MRIHGSEVQAVLANIIKQINPKTDGFTTMDDPSNRPPKSTMRTCARLIKSTPSTISAAYATMLTNKDSITRVYYGDLFTDDGQYMAQKSPYYNAIDALPVLALNMPAGGQDIKVTKV